MWISLMLSGLLLWPVVAQAAIDCADAGAVEVHEDSPADPRTIAYTTPAGSNRVTFVGIGYRSGGNRSTTTATLAGASMTESQAHLWDGIVVGGQLFYYINPPSGTNDVVVNWDPTGSPLNGSVIIFTCTGAAQVSPFRSTAQANATNTGPTVTLGSINAGDMALDLVVADDITSLTVGANQTVIHQGTTGSSSVGVSYQLGADGGVMSWTTGASDQWAIVSVALKPAESADSSGDPLWFP